MKQVSKEEFEAFLAEVKRTDTLGTFYNGLECSTNYYSHIIADMFHIVAPDKQYIVAQIIDCPNGQKEYYISEEYFYGGE